MPSVRRLKYLGFAFFIPLLLVCAIYAGLLQPPATQAAPQAEGFTLSPGYTQLAQPGDTISFRHLLTNTGVATNSFAITATWSVTWPLIIGSDLLPTGSPLSLTLGAGTTATLYVTASVPADSLILSGTQTSLWLTVTSPLSPTKVAVVTDTVLVQTSTRPITYNLYLPTIARFYGGPLVQLGSDFGIGLMLSDTSVLTADVVVARNLGTTWTRAWLPWALIETAPGQYDWTWTDHQLNQFAQAGNKINALIFYPPAWASVNPCGPITDTVAFDNFMTAVVTRYADRVDSWEFINEPDSPYFQPAYGPAIGCWALYSQQYAEYLAAFHAKVKALDPTALVVFGGLAYDNWQKFDRDFLTHTLESGAGSYFDAVSLHFYPINPQDFPTIADKITEIKAILQRHGAYGKAIWITETSMWTNGPDGLAGQLNYIVKEQTRGFCAGADKVFWFAIREELSTPPLKRWLISKQHQPDQGHATYQHYAQQLQDAFCRGAYKPVPAAVEAYQFGRPDGELYIMWTRSGTSQVSLPAGKSATLIDRDGQTSQVLPPSGGMVSVPVSPQPIFVMVKY